MSVRTRIILGTLSFFNAVLLVALGIGSLVFVDGAAGAIVAGVMWFGAGCLYALARRLRRATEWH